MHLEETLEIIKNRSPNAKPFIPPQFQDSQTFSRIKPKNITESISKGVSLYSQPTEGPEPYEYQVGLMELLKLKNNLNSCCTLDDISEISTAAPFIKELFHITIFELKIAVKTISLKFLLSPRPK